MGKWGLCAAVAAVVAVAGQAARADLLPVQNGIFSSPLVTYAQTAMPVVFGVPGWTASGAPDPDLGFNAGVIIWQNRTANDPSATNRLTRVDNLVTDPTITEAVALAHSNTAGHWWFDTDAAQGYQACASIAAGDYGMTQTLSSEFQANRDYALTVAVGHNYGGAGQVPDAQTRFTLSLFYVDRGVETIVTSLDVFNDAGTGLSGTHLKEITTPTATIDPGSVAIGKAINIRLATTTPSGAVATGYFNVTNVRVSEVPEPASIGVFVGAAALLLRRRRR